MVSLCSDAIGTFLSEEQDSAVVMLNLLRFEADGGRKRYLQYLSLATPILARFGATVVFGGDGLPALTAGTQRPWEAVVLVRYPSRTAFKALVDDPEYQRVFPIGASALADILLQPMVPFSDVGSAGST